MHALRPPVWLRPRVALAVSAAALGLLWAAPAAGAQLLVEHDSSVITDTTPGGDGVLGPGDTFTLSEKIRNSEPLLTGISGALSSTTPAVVLTQASSAYPDMAFGDKAANTTPFSGSISALADCGINLAFNLQLSTNQGSQAVPFTVPTGIAGPTRAYDSADVPKAINDNSSVTSNLDVQTPGRVKDVNVRIGRIDHSYVGDLKIELIAPDGTSVVLINSNALNNGQDFVNTVFDSDAAQSITTASAPYTGTFRPEGDLRALNGKQQQGTWKLKVSDLLPANTGSLVSWGTDTRTAVCSGAPVASFTASPNPVTPGGTVNFDGSGSLDPNGTIVKYEWDLDGNGSYETDTGTTPTVSHTYASQGTVDVRLRVTDDSADTGIAIVPVSVTLPPVASFTATPSAPQSGQSVAFDASASSDPDGSIVRYEWDLDGNGTFERDTGSTPTVVTSYAAAGVVTVRLRVTDNNGATATDALDLTVANRPPVAAFAPPSPAVTGQQASFDGSASSDPDGVIVDYAWDLDGNGSFETDTGTDPLATHVYSAAGTVAVKLRVTDNVGTSDTKTLNVTVTHPPVAAFSVAPSPAALNQTVTFNGSASNDPDGPLAKFEWDLDGNGTFERDTGTNPVTTRSYAIGGSYSVKLRVTDADGATDVKTLVLLASNGLPSARLTATPNPVLVGQAVTLDAGASSDPDGSLVRYEWDLDGNGSFETDGGALPALVRSYPNPGTISVRVRVTDNDGGTAINTLALVVNEPVSGGGGGTGGGTGGGGGGSGTGGAGSTFSASLGGSALQRLRTVLLRGLSVSCRATVAGTCRVRVQLTARVARRLGLRVRGARAVSVGSARIVVAAGRATRVRIRLTVAARRALRRARSVTLLVRGSATDAGGHDARLARAFLVRR